MFQKSRGPTPERSMMLMELEMVPLGWRREHSGMMKFMECSAGRKMVFSSGSDLLIARRSAAFTPETW